MKDSDKKIMEADYQEGLAQEEEMLNKLRNKGYTVETTDRYDPFDFKINNKYLIELKTRSCHKHTYNTTLLPYSKLKEYRKVKKQYKDLIVIVRFTDGDFYVSYKDICKAHCKIRPFTRTKGYIHNTKPYIHISVSLLKPLEQMVLG